MNWPIVLLGASAEPEVSMLCGHDSLITHQLFKVVEIPLDLDTGLERIIQEIIRIIKSPTTSQNTTQYTYFGLRFKFRFLPVIPCRMDLKHSPKM